MSSDARFLPDPDGAPSDEWVHRAELLRDAKSAVSAVRHALGCLRPFDERDCLPELVVYLDVTAVEAIRGLGALLRELSAVVAAGKRGASL